MTPNYSIYYADENRQKFVATRRTAGAAEAIAIKAQAKYPIDGPGRRRYFTVYGTETAVKVWEIYPHKAR